VNDEIDAKAIVVTYCPLCGSGVVFERTFGEQTLSFGVSGLLYQSDVLLYDRQTQSLWSQLESKAVTGKFIGKALASIPVEQTTWSDWKQRNPKTKVMSFNTGFDRNYARDPYRGYQNSAQLYFPVSFRQHGLHPKEKVIAIQLDGLAKAWPFIELRKISKPIHERLGMYTIVIKYDKKNDSAKILDNTGKLLPSTTLYWFAWSTFHPKTLIYGR